MGHIFFDKAIEIVFDAPIFWQPYLDCNIGDVIELGDHIYHINDRIGVVDYYNMGHICFLSAINQKY